MLFIYSLRTKTFIILINNHYSMSLSTTVRRWLTDEDDLVYECRHCGTTLETPIIDVQSVDQPKSSDSTFHDILSSISA